jgi:hypothetical protein
MTMRRTIPGFTLFLFAQLVLATQPVQAQPGVS